MCSAMRTSRCIESCWGEPKFDCVPNAASRFAARSALPEQRIRNQGAAVTYERADGHFYLRSSKCMRLGRRSCICVRLQLIDAVSA